MSGLAGGEILQDAIFAIEEAIKLEPKIALALGQMFSKGIPTEADWATFRASVASKDYSQYVPATQLPSSETGA